MSIEQAVEFAELKHQGQKRRSGEDYIEHPKRVANTVSTVTTDANLIIAALLHDTLEDTNATPQEIENLFGTIVRDLVIELTNDRDEIAKIGKAQYMANKVLELSQEALLIKLADRLDNVADVQPGSKYAEDTRLMLDALEYRMMDARLVSLADSISRLVR